MYAEVFIIKYCVLESRAIHYSLRVLKYSVFTVVPEWFPTFRSVLGVYKYYSLYYKCKLCSLTTKNIYLKFKMQVIVTRCVNEV